MKKINPIMIITTLVFFLSSCSILKKEGTLVIGNENIDSKEYVIQDYATIELDQNQEIYYEQRTDLQPYIRVEADENLLRYISPQTKGKKLSFSYLVPIQASTYKVYTNSRELSRISIVGSGSVFVEGVLLVKNLNIDVKGSGSIVIDNMQAKKTNVKISGAGSVELKGVTTSASYDISGTGKIQAEELEADNATCKISGAGTIWLHTSGNLSVNLSGSGDVYYTGNPLSVRQKGKGIGTVKALE